MLHFDEKDKIIKRSLLFFLIIGLYFIEIFISNYLFYVATTRFLGIPLSTILSSTPLLFVILIVPRIFHLIALIAFAFKSRIGWIILVFSNLVNILSNGLGVLKFLISSHFYEKAEKTIVISHTITFFLSIIIIFLSFLKPITSLYPTNYKLKGAVIIIAVIVSVILNLYAGDIIMKMQLPN